MISLWSINVYLDCPWGLFGSYLRFFRTKPAHLWYEYNMINSERLPQKDFSFEWHCGSNTLQISFSGYQRCPQFSRNSTVIKILKNRHLHWKNMDKIDITVSSLQFLFISNKLLARSIFERRAGNNSEKKQEWCLWLSMPWSPSQTKQLLWNSAHKAVFSEIHGALQTNWERSIAASDKGSIQT